MTDPRPSFLRQFPLERAVLGGERRLQVEAWEEGPLARLLLVAQGEAGARAWLVSHDARDHVWSGACVNLHPEASHHDRRVIVDEARLAPLTATDIARLGFLGGEAGLADEAFAFTGPPTPETTALRLATGTGKTQALIQQVGRIHRPGSALPKAADLGYPTALTYGMRQTGQLHGPATGYRGRAPGIGAPPAGIVRPEAERDEAARTRFGEVLAESLGRLRERHVAPATTLLGQGNWTAPAYAFYARQGLAGERRRQAGRLYPAFANAIAKVAPIGDLIDAGRPFESALAEAVAPLQGAVPSLSALRRLRTLPAGTAYEDLGRAIAVADRLPPDWLPERPEGWRALIAAAGPLTQTTDALGLRLPDVVAHARTDWEGLAEANAKAFSTDSGSGRPSRSSLSGARDMAERFRDTLVSQILRASARAVGEADTLRIAGAVLFGGKALPGIQRLQDRWHRGLDRFEAGLPVSEKSHSWPAPFPPYAAGDGIEIVCLTSEADLKAEGAKGADATGAEGLDHCVGGYGKACYTGESHVASIRRRTAGGYVRLSTVEFEAAPDAEGLVAVQHYGRGNARPCAAASGALAGLLAALQDGRHPLDSEALVERDGDEYEDAYDWRDPGAMGQAFATWSAYLPRDVARGGLPALAARIEAVAATLGPAPATPEPGEVRIMYMDYPRFGALRARNFEDVAGGEPPPAPRP